MYILIFRLTSSARAAACDLASSNDRMRPAILLKPIKKETERMNNVICHKIRFQFARACERAFRHCRVLINMDANKKGIGFCCFVLSFFPLYILFPLLSSYFFYYFYVFPFLFYCYMMLHLLVGISFSICYLINSTISQQTYFLFNIYIFYILFLYFTLFTISYSLC